MGTVRQQLRERHLLSLALKIASILACSIVVSAGSQNGTSPSEPPSLSVLYYLGASAKLIPLESQLFQKKQKLHGLTGGENMYLAGGHKSPTRMQAGDKTNFVVRLDGSLDPVEAIQLFHVDVLDRSRVVSIDEFNALGRVSKVTMPPVIDFGAAIYGVSSFRLMPTRVLVPGEYCFLMKKGNEFPKAVPGFCFGIDAP